MTVEIQPPLKSWSYRAKDRRYFADRDREGYVAVRVKPYSLIDTVRNVVHDRGGGLIFNAFTGWYQAPRSCVGEIVSRVGDKARLLTFRNLVEDGDA